MQPAFVQPQFHMVQMHPQAGWPMQPGMGMQPMMGGVSQGSVPGMAPPPPGDENPPLPPEPPPPEEVFYLLNWNLETKKRALWW